MPFITQGKTNWKFLLIVIILAVVVGVGALWYAKRPEKPYQPVEIKKIVENKKECNVFKVSDCDSSAILPDSFNLKYDAKSDWVEGGNSISYHYKGIILESNKYIIRGSLRESAYALYDCGGGPGCDATREGKWEKVNESDMPPDNSSVKINIKTICSTIYGGEIEKAVSEHIEYNGQSIFNYGMPYGVGPINICK